MRRANVVYDWPGVSQEKDKALEKLAKRFGGVCTGSGYFFMTGQRDVGFSFKKTTDCDKFIKAVQAKYGWAEATKY
jgi:hypothetical protein